MRSLYKTLTAPHTIVHACALKARDHAQVGDQSDFVTSFSRVLAETAPRIGPALSPLHFRYFCDKLAVSLCPRFYEYIFRRAPLPSSPHPSTT